MLGAAEVVDDAVRLAYPIWVDLLGDVGRASGDAEHSAQVGENQTTVRHPPGTPLSSAHAAEQVRVASRFGAGPVTA